MKEKFDDSKGIARNHKLTENATAKRKRTNNDIHIKPKDWTTRTPKKKKRKKKIFISNLF